MTHLTAARAAVLLAFAASPALAAAPGSLLSTSSNSTLATYAGGIQALKLSDAGATTIGFTTTKANETVLVSFTLTCNAVAGPSNTQVALQTQYDGKDLLPSGQVYGCIAGAGTTGPLTTTSWSNFVTVPVAGKHLAAVLVFSLPTGSAVNVTNVAAAISH